eukprot:m.74322 g.74322  ORF g.74322 m.74322 type:complete len:444 (+) comp11798_c2_seq1:55-1386(+)
MKSSGGGDKNASVLAIASACLLHFWKQIFLFLLCVVVCVIVFSQFSVTNTTITTRLSVSEESEGADGVQPLRFRHRVGNDDIVSLLLNETNTVSLPFLRPQKYFIGTDTPYYRNVNEFDEKRENDLPTPALMPLKEIFALWPACDADVPATLPPHMVDGFLEVLDYSDSKQRKRAEVLRVSEVPFKLKNVPFVDRTVEKWKHDEYLIALMDETNEEHRVTTSKSHKFRYFRSNAFQRLTYSSPTGTEKMSFRSFLQHQYAAEEGDLDETHYYLQMKAVYSRFDKYRWIFKDLREWIPQNNFWFADPEQNRGINCRFGAKGISSSNHFDSGRNFIALFRGTRRYVIAPPEECPNLHLFPNSHPEARHSEGDWCDIDYEKYKDYNKAKAMNVVLKAGEVLYLPPYWMHYITSNTLTIQCNTRSGFSYRGWRDIKKCGFPIPVPAH